jgi:hypothetical protein
VEFEDAGGLAAAIMQKDGLEFRGKRLWVAKSQPPGRDGGGRGRARERGRGGRGVKRCKTGLLALRDVFACCVQHDGGL